MLVLAVPETDVDSRATQTVLRSVRSSGVPEATIRPSGDGAAIVAGSFESPAAPRPSNCSSV